jgi:hypothetical protein
MSLQAYAFHELLTIAGIEGKFDSEWLLIEDPSTDEFPRSSRWHGALLREVPG